MKKTLSAASARLPDFVEPMKAKLVDSVQPGDWIYEIKFDGYRALALRGGSETRVLSRNEKDLGRKFPACLYADREGSGVLRFIRQWILRLCPKYSFRP